MIKKIISFAVIVSSFFIFNTYLHAATGPANIYKITITKVELCEIGSTLSNCLNPVDITVGGGVADVDIAAVTAGESAGVVADFGKGIPGTTYTYVQTILSRSVKTKGSVGTCYTANAAASGTADGYATGTQTSADEVEVTLLVPSFIDPTNYSMIEGSSDAAGTSLRVAGTIGESDTHFRARKILSAPYTAKAGINPTVFLAFGTSGAIMNKAGTCGSAQTLAAAPPDQTVTIQGQ